jgi:hypothetical protein
MGLTMLGLLIAVVAVSWFSLHRISATFDRRAKRLREGTPPHGA